MFENIFHNQYSSVVNYMLQYQELFKKKFENIYITYKEGKDIYSR